MTEILERLEQICSEKRFEPKFINTTMLEGLYDYSEQQQKHLRGRVKNPLPYYQEKEGDKIRYKVSEIDEWISLQKMK